MDTPLLLSARTGPMTLAGGRIVFETQIVRMSLATRLVTGERYSCMYVRVHGADASGLALEYMNVHGKLVIY